MAGVHIVQQGEHLSGIAREKGFRNFHTIWDNPNNAALREKRDPHVLFPGDKLFIPDLESKTEQRSTGAAHVFAVNATRIFLRLKVLDINNQPVKTVSCDAFVGVKPPDKVTTDSTGLMDDLNPLDPNVQIGQLVVHVQPPTPPPSKDNPTPVAPPETPINFDLRIGALNPETKLSGQQARLNNLGYFAGFALRDLDQFLWAVEEFECDQIAKPVAKRPAIVPAPKAGEDDANNATPGPTGIKDPKIVAALLKVHGI